MISSSELAEHHYIKGRSYLYICYRYIILFDIEMSWLSEDELNLILEFVGPILSYRGTHSVLNRLGEVIRLRAIDAVYRNYPKFDEDTSLFRYQCNIAVLNNDWDSFRIMLHIAMLKYEGNSKSGPILEWALRIARSYGKEKLADLIWNSYSEKMVTSSLLPVFVYFIWKNDYSAKIEALKHMIQSINQYSYINTIGYITSDMKLTIREMSNSGSIRISPNILRFLLDDKYPASSLTLDREWVSINEENVGKTYELLWPKYSDRDIKSISTRTIITPEILLIAKRDCKPDSLGIGSNPILLNKLPSCRSSSLIKKLRESPSDFGEVTRLATNII